MADTPVIYHPGCLQGSARPSCCECCQQTFFRRQLLRELSQLESRLPKSGPHPVIDQCRSTKSSLFQPNWGEIRRVIPVLELPTGLAILLLFLPSIGAYPRALLNQYLARSTLPQNPFPTGLNLHRSPSQILYLICLYLRLLVVSSQEMLYLLIKLLFFLFP